MLSHRCTQSLLWIVCVSTCIQVSLSKSYGQALLSVQSFPHDALMISDLKVSVAQAEGQFWDLKPSSYPDPLIKIYIGGVLSWTSQVWTDRLHPISTQSPLMTSVYRRSWPKEITDAVMKVEIWDKDITSDDLITSFELSRIQLQTMTHTPISLGNSSAHITLAWHSAERVVLKSPPSLPPLRADPSIPQLKVVPHTPSLSNPKPSKCARIPHDPEIDLLFKTPIALKVIRKRTHALIRNNQSVISTAQVLVTPCLEGFDINSMLKLGNGWIRIKRGEIRVVIHRPKLLRKFPKTAHVKRRVIRELCRRILKQKSPQCKR